MALTEAQQITEQIRKARQILIALPKDFSPDAIACALALYLILKKQDKLVDIVADSFSLPKNLKFLPKSEIITDKISSLQKFIIEVDLRQTEIDDLSYNLEGENLKIYLTPKSGALNQEKVNAKSSDYKYDLIITLDAPDLDSLGKIYYQFTEFFYNTTIINLDHHAENQHFGQINLTNLNAVATAEILYNLIDEIDKNLLDQEVATCLLTGLVAKTKSFKTPNVTPKTLEIASALLAAEADRDTIIKSLYRNRSLATLNLWGRVLARLKSDSNNRLIWSLLTEHDFVETQASQDDLPSVVEELISFIPGVEVVVLIYQVGGKTQVLVDSLKNQNAMYLTSVFNPTGNKALTEFNLMEKTLREAEKEVVEEIKKKLGEK